MRGKHLLSYSHGVHRAAGGVIPTVGRPGKVCEDAKQPSSLSQPHTLGHHPPTQRGLPPWGRQRNAPRGTPRVCTAVTGRPEQKTRVPARGGAPPPNPVRSAPSRTHTVVVNTVTSRAFAAEAASCRPHVSAASASSCAWPRDSAGR